MKKIIASAVGLMMVGGVAVTTASAVENQFGGYWRVRSFVQDNFDGQDSASVWRTDNRTRLYYTAKFNDDFKFVNKFEINTRWGDNVGGDIGADGTSIWRIKNSYADFTLGAVRTKLGIQGAAIARGLIFDDDFSGVNISANLGTVTPTFLYIAVDDENVTDNTADENISAVVVPVKIGDAVTLTPYFVYNYRSNDGKENYYIGGDVDLKMDAVSAWGTFVYNGGTVGDVDNAGYLLAGGATASIAHGQIVYATGDDAGTDNDGFVVAPGGCYYWSEIMGLGTFDTGASAGSPGCGITNLIAFNGGVTIKPMDKLTLKGDLWYAMHDKDVLIDGVFQDELGLELDGKVTYALMDNLNLDLVLAYLFSGDATGPEDVLETGARLSLKF